MQAATSVAKGVERVMEDFVSFTEEAVQRCPFPLIEKLHAGDPVYRDPKTGYYVITSYDDIAFANDHPEIFSNQTTVTFGGGADKPGYAEVQRLYDTHGWRRVHTLVTADPPVHTRNRAIIDKIFTPSFVRSLEPYMTSLCDELIDQFINDGATDLYRNYCIKIPMFIIADQLGVPRDKWEMFKRWSDSAIALSNPSLSKEEWIRLVKINIEMQQYLAERQAQYKAEPTNNLLSMLANVDLDGEQLTTQEFVSLGHQLLVAGNETTTGAIARCVELLIRHPEIMQSLRADISGLPLFIEESLRVHSPSPHVYRVVMQDVEISGMTIPAGSVVMISYMAGNYDPKKFECPAQFDSDRKGVRTHLAFGRGIHHCIGNLLARSELKISLTRLLDRLDNIRFDPAFPEPRNAAIFHIHQLEDLHIAFSPRRRDQAA